MEQIAAQLLVGQNPEPFLPYAIRSVVHWVDYFTICNTAPDTDIGKANLEVVWDEIGDKPYRYHRLDPEENGHFSFADARNACLANTDTDDFVLILDADDVHYPNWEYIVREAISQGYDSITAYFYHLMVYKNIYQYIQPREILYKNYAGTHWEKGVHEQLVNTKKAPYLSPYHYLHYGYVKPQREVFNRWKFYSDLEGDFTHYDGQDPENIISDRVNVCEVLPIEPPPCIQQFLTDYPSCPRDALRQNHPRRGTFGEEKVGLVLITMNDEELLDACLDGIANTTSPPDFSVLAIDIGSTDGSLEKLQAWQGEIDLEIVGSEKYVSLSETLNYGFDYFRTDETFRYVGWIHPDMQFIQPEWLHYLWRELQDNPKWGKVSAANFRDLMPEHPIPGHEQCYILRKDILHKIGLFDESYIGIGGYEDWDFNRRIMDHQGPEGFYEVVITPKSWVLHEGMATRSRRDTREEQIRNGQYYYNKWGTWQPPC